MDFTLSEERRMLKETLARFLAENYPIEARHEHAASPIGYAPETWAQLAELGVIGALFDETDGGFGGTGFDVITVFEELGRGLVNEPFLATMLAGTLVAKLGKDEQKALLQAVIAGETRLALAHGEPESRYDPSHVTATATRTAGGWRLDGVKSVALNADSADVLIVSARVRGATWDEDGISLFVVPATSQGVSILGYPTADGLHAAEVTLSGVSVGDNALLGPDGEAFPEIEAVLARGAVALSAEAVGLMEVCRDATIEYLQTRRQFGVPIGKFQALQHRMATVILEIEQARSSVINAAGQLDAPRAPRERAAAAAKAMAGRIGRLVAEEAIQMHGGIAMTWEYAVGHYAKRLVMIDHQLGDVDHHTARFAALAAAAPKTG
ncbi:acyl-CoA dehydrogenase family protein [Oricola sp.]|uniref:acyl-CoA dehydrogenase family protein n=1 Tax=Oricola sp. TaxID=1979950 RepID=UPI003BA8B4E6